MFSSPSLADDRIDRLASTIPAHRVAQATELMGAAVYLASDEASYVDGVTLPVDGGSVAALSAGDIGSTVPI